MDTKRFETITHSLTSLPSRRDVVRGFAGAGLGLTTLLGRSHGISQVAAKKKRKKKKKKPKQSPPASPPFNEFGCLDVGQPCQGDSSLCCSGICDGVCVAHDSGVCFPDTDTCTTGQSFRCHPTRESCLCVLTTGNAGFCADIVDLGNPAAVCRFCSQDTDCQEEFGPGAACVVLKGLCSAGCATTGRTACMRPCA